MGAQERPRRLAFGSRSAVHLFPKSTQPHGSSLKIADVTQRVFVDANIFYSKTLRDWLFFLRQENAGMFQIHTTEHVIAEVLANKLKKHPTAQGNLISSHVKQIRACLDEIVEDFSGKAAFTGADIHDYHVHAAAIACRADIILTNNNPKDITQTPDAEPYEIYTPDEFFTLVANSNPSGALKVTRGQFEYWRQKPGSIAIEMALRNAGCKNFAGMVRLDLQTITLTQ